MATRTDVSSRNGLAIVILVGAATAVAMGVYARVHEAAGRPLFTLGFSGMLQMKTWLTTAATLLLIVQLLTALWMWRRLPGAGSAPPWAPVVHRWVGSTAFVLTLPVAFHCIWSIGFATYSTRAFIHGVLGCVFYGAYTSKMMALRMRGLSGWALPILGGTVFASFVLIWLTSALWFFTRAHVPLT